MNDLRVALEWVLRDRHSASAAYLTDMVASLAFGGTHRGMAAFTSPSVEAPARDLAFSLIAAKRRNAYTEEEWEDAAHYMLEITTDLRRRAGVPPERGNGASAAGSADLSDIS